MHHQTDGSRQYETLYGRIRNYLKEENVFVIMYIFGGVSNCLFGVYMDTSYNVFLIAGSCVNRSRTSL
jgi:hypothetical protein